MRFELAECEWAAIKPMLPISRGGSRVNDRACPTCVTGCGCVLMSPCPSVLIPKFASFCGDLVCELRNRKDTSKLLFLVWLWFRSPHDGRAATMMRSSEPPH